MMRIDEKENWGGYFEGGEAADFFLGGGIFFLQMVRIDEKGRGGGSSKFYGEIINGRSLRKYFTLKLKIAPKREKIDFFDFP